MVGIREALRLYGHYMSLNIRSAMQHKASFFMQIAGQLITSFTTFLGLFFMFQRFHRVKGYTYSDVLLCFSIVLMQFSLAEMFARGFDAFSGMVRRGEFDRVLVRPRNEALQVLGSRFELTRIGRLIQAALVFAYGMATADVAWTAGRVMTVLSMLLGGTALFSGLFLIYAALCFFTVEGLEFMNVFTDGGMEYGKYPIDVYGRRMQRFATYVIPYTLVQYYPLQYLLGRSENGLYGLYPLGAPLFLAACYALWRVGVAHYTSTGS